MQLDRTGSITAQRSTWPRQAILGILSHLKHGELCLSDPLGDSYFGQSSPDSLKVHIQINDLACYRLMLLGGSNGAAEAFIQGLWQTQQLTQLIQLLLRNRSQLNALEGFWSRFSSTVSKLWHHQNRNTRSGSQRNIAAHYDLGNDFFKLFLDSHLMYSSAIYRTPEDNLEQASVNKLEAVCQKLQLQPNDRVIEIGTGWGGMAIYAAKHFGCHVTTTTISEEQYQAARQRVEAANLQDRVTVLKQDYRDLNGQFDKLISIEMVEAVGHQFLGTWFSTLQHLLKPQGLALIQAITIDDKHYLKALKQVDYIKRYIFPGSFIPCVSVLTQQAAKSNLRLIGLEDIGHSYALTLKAWADKFNDQLDQVRSQGFDERFIRMWQFYLSYCEGGFLEQAISDVQMLFRKTGPV